MGKIITVLVALMMVVGCSSSNEQEFIDNMRIVNISMTEVIEEMSEIMKTGDKSHVYSKMKDLAYIVAIIEKEARKVSPPEALKKEHEHYISFISEIGNSAVSAALGGDDFYEITGRASKEIELAKPLLDKIKGER